MISSRERNLNKASICRELIGLHTTAQESRSGTRFVATIGRHWNNATTLQRKTSKQSTWTMMYAVLSPFTCFLSETHLTPPRTHHFRYGSIHGHQESGRKDYDNRTNRLQRVVTDKGRNVHITLTRKIYTDKYQAHQQADWNLASARTPVSLISFNLRFRSHPDAGDAEESSA